MKKEKLSKELCEEIWNLHRNIRRLRIEHGLSLAQMAEIAGISEKRMAAVEACEESGLLRVNDVWRICCNFQVSLDRLFQP